jgi:hypothetical protein
MQPPSYSLFNHVQTKEDELARGWAEANDSGAETREPNWLGVIMVGMAFFVMGILLAGVSGGGSLIFVFLGIIIVLGALSAGKFDLDEPVPDVQPEEYYDDSNYYAQDYDLYRQQLRQEEIRQVRILRGAALNHESREG